MNSLGVTDDKPAEPEDPHYLAQKASAAACFKAKDFLGAKAIYTELLYDPAYRNAVVYCNRSIANFKLNLPLSSYDDAQMAVILSNQKWRKPIYRVAEAASVLGMHKVAINCFAVAGLQDKAEALFRSFETKTQQQMFDATYCYTRRPQVPPKDPEVIAQAIDEINSQFSKIAVRDAPGMGRGIFAMCDFAEGDTILIDKPFVAAIVEGDRCQQCFRELTPTARYPNPPVAVTCSGCGVERYCSEQCRKQAWELYHRVQCAHATALKAARDFAATGRSTSAISSLVVARLAGMTTCSPSWPCHTLSLPQLQLFSPTTSSDAPTDASQLFTLRRRAMQALGLDHEPRFDLEWFEAVFGLVQTNNFTVAREGKYDVNREGSKLGSGLYPTASLLNHSCAPNATWHAGCFEHDGSDFPFNSMTVRATKPIRRGQQIFITYVPLNYSYSDRQMRLRATYGFNCSCPKCKREKP